MLNIGRKQKLVVVKKVEFGIYLGETREAGEKERVLLPIKQVPEGTKEGDELAHGNQNQEQVVNIKFALSPFAIKEKRFDIKNNRNRQERIYRRRLYNIFQCICI